MNDKEAASNRFEASKKNLIKIDIDKIDQTLYERKLTTPRTPEEELALELALTLHDREGLPFYRHCTREYTEPFLRGILAKVMSIPNHKIKKSRGALFNFLVDRQNM